MNRKKTAIWVIIVLVVLVIAVVIVASCGTARPSRTYVTKYIYPEGAVLDTTLTELPEFREGEILIVHDGYISSYNPEELSPNWVAYNLTREEIAGENGRNGSFKADPAYPGRQASNQDYTRSGYDKGHLAPAADMKWTTTAMTESFYFTNIAPQSPKLNRYYWLAAEEMTREMADRYGNVWVISGPVFGDGSDAIGGGVSVPRAFFKALMAYDGTKYTSIAFLMYNNDEDNAMEKRMLSVDALEDSLGLDLFHNLDRKIQSVSESCVHPEDWGLQ